MSDLNNLANALTTQNQAKVILITDACHAGKLAGDFYKGKELTAKNLRLVLNNQVRLAACQASQLAAEGPGWGGGRGVFSYYLLKGLEGFATPVKDAVIRLENLKAYIDSSFKNDEGLKFEKHKQQPVIDGSPLFPLAFFDSASFSTAQNKLPVLQKAAEVKNNGLQSLKSLGEQPIDYFFAIANKADLDTMLIYKDFVNTVPSEIPLKILSDYLEKLRALKKIFTSVSKDDLQNFTEQMNKQLFERDEETIQKLITQLQNNNFLVERFNENLVQLAHKKSQTIVNAYLNGDLAELENRQYYSIKKNPYENILGLIQIALNITPTNNYLHKIIRVNKYYLTGLELRMQTAISKKNSADLLQEAFKQQQQALQLEPFAAYLYNELGNLYMQKNNYDSAIYNYNYASALAPTWAIPYSNKIRFYLATKNPTQAIQAARIADSLQPNLAIVNVNTGLVMEKDSNWLAATFHYLNAIAQNNRHYLPYERLGFVYINTGDYAKASYYFKEADLRKKNYAINDKVFQFGVESGGTPHVFEPQVNLEFCNLSAAIKIPRWEPYITLSKTLPLIITTKQITAAQIKTLNDLLKKNPDLPFASHYLGKEYFKVKEYAKAAFFLGQAIQNQIPENELLVKLSLQLKKALAPQTLLSKKDSLIIDSCLLNTLQNFKYDLLEDYYMLANIYEQNKNLPAAITLYKKANNIENERLLYQANYTDFEKNNKPNNYEENIYKYEMPIKMGAALKMAELYEQLGNLDSAETILLYQINKNRKAGFARQARMNKGIKGATGSPLNIFWLLANEDLEAAAYNFYTRQLAKHPRDGDGYKKAGQFLYERLALTYNQIPAAEQKHFYNYSLNYSYPYRSGEEDANASPENIKLRLKINNQFQLPVTDENITIEMQIYDPLKTAVTFINSAIKYSGENDTEAKLLLNLAHLHSWMGITEEAIINYKKYLNQLPQDVTIRNELINYLNSINQNVAELEQLNILYKNNNLNNEQYLKLAHYKILSNKNEEAILLLKRYSTNNTADSNNLKIYNTQILINKGAYAAALIFLKDTNLFNLKSIDETMLDENRTALQVENENYYNSLYTQVRMYAFLRKNKTALQLLKNLMDSNFVYEQVLKNDPALKNIRKKKKWKNLVANYNFQEQDTPASSDSQITWKSSLDYRIPKKEY